MGQGKGFNLSLIMKIVALICCAVAVGVNVDSTMSPGWLRPQLVSTSLLYAAGGYIIVLGYFLIWSIIKNPVDELFAAIILICGFLWNAGAGIGLLVFKIDYSYNVDTLQLVSGILSLVAGVVMLADGLHNLGIF